MTRDIFKFKQFEVEQRRSAMKVGTDGVLLGAWSEVRGDEARILDIGSGTGLLALMMAQRNATAMVEAVEIEPLAAEEAAENCARSPWAERVTVHQTSLQEYAPRCDVRYDLIVSNPPYFINSPINEQLARTAARHALLLPYADLVDGVVALLAPAGRFSAIFPALESGIFIAKAEAKGLYCNKLLKISPIEGRPAKRVAAQFSFVKTEIEESTLAIETETKGDYTDHYRRLTAPFYIRF